ncbi:SH3 domain-containing protein C23A1.17-like isoform X2 [Onychomys torridus]|uniref:SH3 domain-containing protein C23A1.17-like isoform X2 n=1 Tax=Onychomys torridus TaxID=38674 RepID=UPI00167FC22B|nr:SH3 domain-containing protein C23A1.17-like isoform X2 [Onychomys torridus]
MAAGSATWPGQSSLRRGIPGRKVPQGKVDTETVLSHDKSRKQAATTEGKACPKGSDTRARVTHQPPEPQPSEPPNLLRPGHQAPPVSPLSVRPCRRSAHGDSDTPHPPHPAATPLPRTHLGAPHRTAPSSSALDRAGLSAHARRRPRPTSTRLRAAHPERPASPRRRL